MKFLMVLGLLTSFASLSLGDAMPPEWRLPNKGAGCVLQNRFADGKTCGSKRYEVWVCPDKVSTDGSRPYLLVGEYQTDTLNSCSPTYVVNKVLAQ